MKCMLPRRTLLTLCFLQHELLWVHRCEQKGTFLAQRSRSLRVCSEKTFAVRYISCTLSIFPTAACTISEAQACMATLRGRIRVNTKWASLLRGPVTTHEVLSRGTTN